MNHFQIIIIGGGMSGLSACIKLLESGVNNILLLEASDRIGGRINTIPYENSFIELGAQWIHGTKGNPIYELSKILNLTDDRKIREGTMYYATQDGTQLNEDYVDRIFEKIEQIFENLDDLIENELEDDSDQSLGYLLDDGFVKILKKLKQNENSNIELIKSIYRSRLHEEKNETASDDLRRVSAVGWNEYEDFEGEQFARLKYGYGKVLDYFVSQMPRECFKLNQIVKKIDWSETSVKLEIYDNKTKSDYFLTADHILCTVSLGCLKQNHLDLFRPNLPLNKIKAIENLGFGCVDKLFICYDSPVLKKNSEGMKIFWRDDLNFRLDSSDKWNFEENSKFYKSLDNFELLPNLPNVFVCFVVGRDAIFIEKLEEECLIDVVYELFCKCFSHLDLPRPSKILKSSWYSNKFTNGSYSFIKTGSSINDVRALAQPLENKLYFAGEATTYKHMSTVHGAYISGREAANKILKLIKN